MVYRLATKKNQYSAIEVSSVMGSSASYGGWYTQMKTHSTVKHPRVCCHLRALIKMSVSIYKIYF